MAVLHDLKTWTEYFDRVWDGSKSFELRKDDRDFAIGDTLRLRDYDPGRESYLGRAIYVEVTCVVRDAPQFGLMPGHAILGFDPSSRVLVGVDGKSVIPALDSSAVDDGDDEAPARLEINGEQFGVRLVDRGPGDPHVCFQLTGEDDGFRFPIGSGTSSHWLDDLINVLQTTRTTLGNYPKEGHGFGWRFPSGNTAIAEAEGGRGEGR